MSASNVHMSVELLETHTKLLQIQNLLTQLRSAKSKDMKQLPKLQAALLELENQFKVDGIWCGNLQADIIPAGQAQMNELLDDCHDIIDCLHANQKIAISTSGGQVDQAKLRLASRERPLDPAVDGSGGPHHVDGGLIDQTLKKLEAFEKPIDEHEDQDQLTNEAIEMRTRTHNH